MAEAVSLALTAGGPAVSFSKGVLTREAKKRIGRRRAKRLIDDALLEDLLTTLSLKCVKKSVSALGSTDWSLAKCPLSAAVWNKLTRAAQLDLVVADATNRFEVMIETIKDEWTIEEVIESGVGSITGLTPACRLSMDGLAESLSSILLNPGSQTAMELIRRYPMHGGYMKNIDANTVSCVRKELTHHQGFDFVADVLQGQIDSWLFRVDETSATAMDFHVGTCDLIPGVFSDDVLSWGVISSDTKRYERFANDGMKSVAFLMMLERGCDCYLVSGNRNVVLQGCVYSNIQVIWSGGDISGVILSGSSGYRIRVNGKSSEKAQGDLARNITALGMQHEAYWNRNREDIEGRTFKALLRFRPESQFLKELADRHSEGPYTVAETALFDFRKLPNRMRAILRQSEKGILVYRLLDAVGDFLKQGRFDPSKVTETEMRSRTFQFEGVTREICFPLHEVVISLLCNTKVGIENSTEQEIKKFIDEEMGMSIVGQGLFQDLEFGRLKDNLKRVVSKKATDGCFAATPITSTITVSLSASEISSTAAACGMRTSEIVDIAYCAMVSYKDGEILTSKRLFRKVRDSLSRDGLCAMDDYVAKGVQNLIMMSADLRYLEYSDCIEKLILLSLGKQATSRLVRFVLLEADRRGLLDECGNNYSWRLKQGSSANTNGKSASLPLEECEYWGHSDGMVRLTQLECAKFCKKSNSIYLCLERMIEDSDDETVNVIGPNCWLR